MRGQFSFPKQTPLYYSTPQHAQYNELGGNPLLLQNPLDVIYLLMIHTDLSIISGPLFSDIIYSALLYQYLTVIGVSF